MKRYIENSKNYYIHYDGSVSREGKFLKLNTNRYKQVVIFNKDGTQSRWYVHRLVATYFIPNPENKPQVNHIDGNKHNNNCSNLEWVTSKENANHATTYLKSNVGEKQGSNVYPESLIKEVCRLLQEGRRNIDISKKTGVPKGTIGCIKAGYQWKHVSKNYKFPKRTRTISDSTARWVCHMLSEGHRHNKIIEEADCKKLDRKLIDSILHRKAYKDISKDFNFK